LKDIPFKQTDSISNEYLFLLLLAIIILSVAFFLLIRYLKSKGFVNITNSKEQRIKVIEKKYVSANTKLFLVKLDNKEYLLTESTANVHLIECVEEVVSLSSQGISTDD